MPPGSTVWMQLSSSACPPDFVGGDCASSNQAGPAPPNGVPLTTYFNRVTGFAEILPDRVRTYTHSQQASAFMYASFQDTYTVVGTATGPFDITVQLRVTGSVSSVQVGPFHQFVGGVEAEIGTFFPDATISGVPLNEGFRVNAFPVPGTSASAVHNFTSPGTIPVDITASYTKTGVNVGDVFDIAYGVNTSFSRGEIDLLNTGTISFNLPPGVRLISSLAQSLVPEPNALVLVTLALAAAIGPRRWRTNSL
jgi:hypothetical protein